MVGESKFIVCLGFSIKCLQTSELQRVWHSFKCIIEHPTNIQNTVKFVKQIQESSLTNSESSTEQNLITTLFDVNSLFTNIPVDFMTDLIINKIFDSNERKPFMTNKTTASYTVSLDYKMHYFQLQH